MRLQGSRRSARPSSMTPPARLRRPASSSAAPARGLGGADIIVCRSGASTVTEIAAVGAAALFVPFPSAVDDHQTTNARFLVDAGGGWLVQQRDLTPEGLSQMLLKLERPALVDIALKAKNMQKINATREVVTACEELA